MPNDKSKIALVTEGREVEVVKKIKANTRTLVTIT